MLGKLPPVLIHPLALYLGLCSHPNLSGACLEADQINAQIDISDRSGLFCRSRHFQPGCSSDVIRLPLNLWSQGSCRLRQDGQLIPRA